MSIAALIRRMAELGAPAEAIALAVEAIEAEQAKDAERRAKRAEQKRKERLSRDSRIIVARHDGDEEATPSPSPEVFPHTPFPNPNLNPDIPSKNTPKGVQKGSPFEALSAVLQPETARAVVEHRQRIRKPLTAHAAELLARKFAQCPDPNAAADAMIGNGWQGFDPSWLDRPNARGSPPKRYTYVDAANEILAEMRENERTQNQSPDSHVQRISDHGGGHETAVEYLPPARLRTV